MSKGISRGFGLGSSSMKRWEGMPEYRNKDQAPWQTILVHLASREDRESFSALIGQRLTDKTRAVWHPKQRVMEGLGKHYAAGEKIDPRYPVYVISKGRWKSCLTSKALESMGVPYRIVVEPQECDEYAAVIDPAKILVLPFSNLGQGSIPARNWVWEHSIAEGAKRHWIMDDNIYSFWRRQDDLRIHSVSGGMFRAMEDFSDRFLNVVISGPHYYMFSTRFNKNPPFILNTRVYSCILIRNDIPYRWRGRYNEDTDLCLRVLKDGLCTVTFFAFLAKKAPTMTIRGGNTEDLYMEDGRQKMAESLRDQHPDVVKVVWKWGRWQHSVDYAPFRRNKPVRDPSAEVKAGKDDYGMELKLVRALDRETGKLILP